ncbi:MAG: YfhO family protein, partial [Candidatus Aminicenantes bacterium]
MLDIFRYGASLENYTGHLFLCMAFAFYYLKPTRFIGPVSIIASTYLLVSGGHPQMMYLGLLGSAIVLVVIPFILRKISEDVTVNHRHLVNYFKTSILCVICGIFLSSLYILPFYFEFLAANAHRAGQSFQFALEYSSTITGMLGSFFAPLNSEINGYFGSSSIIILIIFIPLLYIFRIKVPLIVTSIWVCLALIFLCSLGEGTPLYYYFWKYFPLANSFRAPGRLSMLFPFLFLLLMAWLFRERSDKEEMKFRKRLFLPYFFVGALSILPFLFFNRGWIKGLPKLKFVLPRHINSYQRWVDDLIFWLGLFTLIIVVILGIRFSGLRKRWRMVVGFLLVTAVVIQVTVEFRYGTWIVKNRKQPTIARMDKLKGNKLTFYGSPGFGMESHTVHTQKKISILEPRTAKFFRNYKYVPSQDEAYLVLNKENVADLIVIETPKDSEKPFIKNTQGSEPVDIILLKEASFNRLLFSVDAGEEGFFALSYPFSENWNVVADGKNAKIYRANGYMIAVPLIAGIHEVEFRYWSVPAFVGMVITCLTIITLGIFFSFRINKPKRRLVVILLSFFLAALLFFTWYTS